MPGMPVLVNSILAAVPKLGDVVIILGLLIVVMGIGIVHTFQGSTHYRCAMRGYVEPQTHPSLIIGDPAAVTYLSHHAHSHLGRRLQGTGAFLPRSALWDTGLMCDPTAYHDECADYPDSDGWTCAYFEDSPNLNITTFDSFGNVIVIILQALTFETWSEPMYDLVDATGTAVVTTIWVFIVFFGGFFLVNLFLAVLFQEFVTAQAYEKSTSEAKALRLKEAVARRARRLSAIEVIQRCTRRRLGTYDHKSVGWDKMVMELRKMKKLKRRTRIDAGALLFGEGDDPLSSENTERSSRQAPSFWDCAPPEGSWRDALSQLVTAPWFGNASVVLVLVNLVLMCLPYYGMPKEDEDRLEGYGTIISWIFIVEMALKLTAFGCAGYWSDTWNRLDGTIVSLSILEMLASALASGMGLNLSFLRILRMLRVARVLRLMRSWQGLYKIVSTIVKALPQLSNVILLLILVCTIFSLLGMQLFGGMFTEEYGYGPLEDGLLPLTRFHFDYYVPAMLTVFIVMTGDAWFAPMLDGISVLGPAAAVFYIVIMMIGTYVMMNLLVAVLLQLFSEKVDTDGDKRRDSMDVTGNENSELPFKKVSEERRRLSKEGRRSSKDSVVKAMSVDDDALGCMPPDDPFRRKVCELIESPVVDRMLMASVIASSFLLVFETPRLDASSALGILLWLGNYLFTLVFLFEAVCKIISYGFLWTPNAYLKTSWNVLDFLLLLISVGAILSEAYPQLVFLRPLRALRVLRPLRILSRNKGMALVLSSLVDAMPAVANVVGVVLAIQVVFAILGMQLFAGSFQACTDPAVLNAADCHGSAVPHASIRRELTTIKSRTEPDHGNLSWARDPPLGAPMYSAALTSVPQPYTIEPSPSPIDDPYPRGPASHAEPNARYTKARAAHRISGRRLKAGGGAFTGPREWTNPIFGSFDDFGQSMLLLFVISTGDDWDKIMFWAMDSNGPGLPRSRNDFSPSCLFFVVWTFVGCFFAMQLFVGVVVEQFNSIRSMKDGSATMTVEQKQWQQTMKTLAYTRGKVKPVRNKGYFNELLFDFLCSEAFKWVVTLALVGSVYNQCSDRWGQPSDSTFYHVRQYFNLGFTMESALKLYTFGFNFWTKDEWCIFENFLVAASLVDELGIIRAFCGLFGLSPYIVKLVSSIQAMRTLRLLQHAEDLKKLLVTIVVSLPSLINVSLLLLLVIFIYSVLGVQLFTYLQRGDLFTEDRNFDDFGEALLVSFETLTGDGWSSMMFEARADTDHGGPYATAYFFSYQLLCSNVILNLVVAVILENFTSIGGANEDLVAPQDIERFTKAWSSLDPSASQMIPVQRLPDLLGSLPQPMGLKGAPRIWLCRVSIILGLSSDDGNVHFKDVLDNLVQFNYRQQTHEEEALKSIVRAQKRLMEGEEDDDDDDDKEEDQDSSQLQLRVGNFKALWQDDSVLPPGKQKVAKTLMIEFLKHSRCTTAFRKVVSEATREARKAKRQQVRQELEAMKAFVLRQRALIPNRAERLRKALNQAVEADNGSYKKAWHVAATKALMYKDTFVRRNLLDDYYHNRSRPSSPVEDHRKDSRASSATSEQVAAPKPPTISAASQKEEQGELASAPRNVLSPNAVRAAPALYASTESVSEATTSHINRMLGPATAVETALHEKASAVQEETSTVFDAKPSPADAFLPELGAVDRAMRHEDHDGVAPHAQTHGVVFQSSLDGYAAASTASRGDEGDDTRVNILAGPLPTTFEAKHVKQGKEPPDARIVDHVKSRIEEIKGQVQAASVQSVVVAGGVRSLILSPSKSEIVRDSKRFDTAAVGIRGTDAPEESSFFFKPAIAYERFPTPRGAMSFGGKTLVMTLEGEITQFRKEDEKELLRRLAAYARIPIGQLVVLGKRSGSVVIEIGVLDSDESPTAALQLVKAFERVTAPELSTLLGCRVLDKKVTALDGYAPLLLPERRPTSHPPEVASPPFAYEKADDAHIAPKSQKDSSWRSVGSESEVDEVKTGMFPTAPGLSADNDDDEIEHGYATPTHEHFRGTSLSTRSIPFKEWWQSPTHASPSSPLRHGSSMLTGYVLDTDDDFLKRLEAAESHDRAAKRRRECRDCGLCGVCMAARPPAPSMPLLEEGARSKTRASRSGTATLGDKERAVIPPQQRNQGSHDSNSLLSSSPLNASGSRSRRHRRRHGSSESAATKSLI